MTPVMQYSGVPAARSVSGSMYTPSQPASYSYAGARQSASVMQAGGARSPVAARSAAVAYSSPTASSSPMAFASSASVARPVPQALSSSYPSAAARMAPTSYASAPRNASAAPSYASAGAVQRGVSSPTGYGLSQQAARVTYGGGAAAGATPVPDPVPVAAPAQALAPVAPAPLVGGFGSTASTKASTTAKSSNVKDILEKREELKMTVIKCFKLITGKTGQKKVNIAGLQELRGLLIRELGVTPDVFGDLESEYIRFDFDGSGFLEANEVYKLIKFELYEYLKQIGGIEPVAIPMKASLEEAGYTVTKELGRGNQATLNLGCDRHGNQRAIKSFVKGRIMFGGLQDMQEEFEVMQRLACKNIARTYEMFQDAQYVYMINEVYLGGDLVSLTKNARNAGVPTPFPEDWWRGIFRQCFEALEFMHQQAIMHCDIKEPNLMVRNKDYTNPEIVLIDLGVAKAMTAADNGSCSGTPGYIPPETYQTAKWFPGGDCFSLGVTIVQLLTDSVPDEELAKRGILKGVFLQGCRSLPEIQRATETREPPFAQMARNMPGDGGLVSLCRRLLSKQLRARPKAPVVLKDPWFSEAGGLLSVPKPQKEAPELRMMPDHPLATVGITEDLLTEVSTQAVVDDFKKPSRAGGVL